MKIRHTDTGTPSVNELFQASSISQRSHLIILNQVILHPLRLHLTPVRLLISQKPHIYSSRIDLIHGFIDQWESDALLIHVTLKLTGISWSKMRLWVIGCLVSLQMVVLARIWPWDQLYLLIA